MKVKWYLAKLQLPPYQSILKLMRASLHHEVIVATSKKILPSSETSELLSFQEEAVVRLNKGIGIDLDKPLKRKSNNPEIVARLEQLEREIIARARAKGIIN